MRPFQNLFRYSLVVPARSRSILLFALFFVSALSQAQHHRWYLSGFSGTSLIILGSQDERTGNGLGVAYETGPESKLRWGRARANLVLEAYYDLTSSPGVRNTPPNTSIAWGTLAMARYRYANTDSPTGFLDIGWGLQYADQTTRDLSTKLNSTPVIDVGFEIGREHPGVLVAARLLHISNAGTVRKNKGQNELFLLIQIPL
jgi:hypothetical protein